MNKNLISLIFLLVGISKVDILNADTNYWPMFKHDARRTGQSIYPGPDCCDKKWKFTGSGYFYSSPAVRVEGNDTLIYIGNRGSIIVGNSLIYAIKDLGSGSVAKEWEYSTGKCVYSSPLIDTNGLIYVPVGDPTFGPDKFYCLYQDKTVKWTIPSFSGSFSSPVMKSGTIYVGSYDDKLYAINSDDGSIYWTFATGGDIQSSPAIGPDGTIYVGSDDNKLYAIEDSVTYGKCKWTYQAGGKIRSSPAIGSDGTIYFSTLEDRTLYALNPDSTLKWTYPLPSRSTNNFDFPPIISSPAIGLDGTIYIGAIVDTVHAVEPDSGKRKWATYLPGGIPYWDITSSPALSSNGYVYIGTADDDYVMGSTGALFILKQSDGGIVCSYKTADEVWGSPAIGPNYTAYFGDCSGEVLYAIQCGATGIEEEKKIDEIKLLDIYPNPFIDETFIEYETGKSSTVSMRIYDLSGRLVKVLVDEIQESGIHKASWDGIDESGKPLPRGIYYCTTQCNEKSVTRKLVLIK